MKLLHINRFVNLNNRMLVAVLLAFCSIFTLDLQGQVVSISALECQCQNNNGPLNNGLFGEVITINGGGPWSIVSTQNLYDPSSEPGSLVDFVPGRLIQEVSTGVFVLEAERVNETNWNLQITDGNGVRSVDSRHFCRYPGPEMLGDFAACLETSDTYSIDADPLLLNNIVWTLSGGGTLLPPNGGQSVTVEWGDVETVAMISVTGEAQAFEDQGTAGRCAIDFNKMVVVANEDTSAMACNTTINVSMNNSCELFLTPDMILEDPVYGNDSYEIELRDVQADTIIPTGVIGMDYIDKVVEVKVIHECSGNSCWGIVNLEDKNIPELICNPDITIDCNDDISPEVNGFPVPADATVTKVRDNVYTVIGFDKCTPLTLRYRDESNVGHCDSVFSSVITRFWSIEDQAGNTDTCSSRIFVRKATLAAITFPVDYDDFAGPGNEPSILACDNSIAFLPNGLPDPYAPNGTGAPEGIFCLNVIVNYEDTRVSKCGDDDNVSYKLIRKWIVTDLCSTDGTNNQRIQNQNIVVVDKTPVNFVAPDDFSSSTTGYACGSDIDIPAPILIFECSSWDYDVSYSVELPDGTLSAPSTRGVTRNNDGTYNIDAIDENTDELFIIYTATDACGNTSTAQTSVEIIDDLPPVPVCDRNSFVALNDEGIGWAGVNTFDDGSNDNCGIDKLEIRRMNASPCGVSNDWGQKIKFCCEDVGVETMVSLRVTDLAGNSNTCMVLVTVQDNQKPELTNCPSDRTVNCDADIFNLGAFGFPGVEDLCGADVEELDPVRNINNCGVGTVLRTFVATDRSGNTSSCNQVINVQPTGSNRFTRSDITFPRDHTIDNGCMDSGIDPEDLPSGKQFPIIRQEACSNATYDYHDVVFQFTEGACFKILREWTVIDWCSFDGVTGAGVFTEVQTIMVSNSTPPSVVEGCRDQDLEVEDLGNCRSRISLTAAGEDDCSDPGSLRFSYEIDKDNDGKVDETGNSNIINTIVDHGTFTVTWTVTDECDNSSICTKEFIVDDTKKPTPYCLTEIITVIMADTKEVDIWAIDFNRGSFDNCTPQDELTFAFSEDKRDRSHIVRCEDLVDGEVTQDLRMYVFDNQDNFDYCEIRLNVQDNSGHCEENLRIALGGRIANEANEIVEGIEVKLLSDQPEYPLIKQVDIQGEFMFEDLPMYEDYAFVAEKQDNPLDGISTLDLVLIQRHILGIAQLNSAYKAIAADVNGDQKISAADLVNLRKLILGITNELPNGENWRFINSEMTFENMNKPFPYESGSKMQNLDHSEQHMDFVALKVGDVNNSHSTNLRTIDSDNRSKSMWTYDVEESGNIVVISIKSTLHEVLGFQYAIQFDPQVYEFEGIESTGIDFDSDNLGLSDLNDGIIKLSWNTSQPVVFDGEIMRVMLSKKLTKRSAISFDNSSLKAEVYTQSQTVAIRDIQFIAEEVADITFEIYQNVPNPFDNTTTIGFNLERDDEVQFKVFDTSGKLLYHQAGSYFKGYNAIVINVDDIPASGVMYYQIETSSHSASRKMIVVK